MTNAAPNESAAERPRGRRGIRVLLAVVVVLLLVVVGFLVWAKTVMQGERPAALEAWTDDRVSIESFDDSVVMTPVDAASDRGLVFIPGAKVDPYAYLAKLADAVAETGTTVVITKPTLNLAFFDLRPLSTFTGHAPDVDEWYVGGHSLGGVKACMMAADEEVAGIVFFGSYCANDVSGDDLSVLSISGSEDGLSTPDKIEGAAHLVPADTTFVEIEGANHASFGDYGVQPGDGVATASDDDVRAQITEALVAFWG
ncbi:pimeloyl-ACP methyl ester carboxylesterase [Agromyces terreus]|uniref:Pimeloyl-ACP methyl ester carboxylesterase n=1 Tax=Agromyces terreus TaxID=424795 RepID=A0A9X2H0F9_9MICO|nr:alpha/beta hydrolase [Agromyces terreus]MCP2372525.1 pimeloyl-ACP methyl ester carboxylesterase [Agromyces terreus]